MHMIDLICVGDVFQAQLLFVFVRLLVYRNNYQTTCLLNSSVTMAFAVITIALSPSHSAFDLLSLRHCIACEPIYTNALIESVCDDADSE